MKNAIKSIATGLVISLASASFAQTNSGGKITAPTDVVSKDDGKITAPTDIVGKDTKGVLGYDVIAPVTTSNVDKNAMKHRAELKANGVTKQDIREAIQKRKMHANRGNDSKFEAFQDNHPRFANLIMSHRSSFATAGISARQAMHRATARHSMTR